MSNLAIEQRLCALRTPDKIFTGLDAVADRVAGVWQRRGVLDELEQAAGRIDALGEKIAGLSDAALRDAVQDSAHTLRRNTEAAATERALAALREAAFRTTGLRPFAVQLMGALCLRRGCLAEMATGEGKSLTAALAAALAAFDGRPCHVVTVNDYLAARDAAKFRPFYEWCGLTASAVTGEMGAAERARGHGCDVTYTTSKELCADFLRDRLCLGTAASATRWNIRLLRGRRDGAPDGVVMRGLHTAIVDEADSVLIDEAVTPLIIAGSERASGTDDAFAAASLLARDFQRGVEYRCHESFREIELLAPGLQRLEEIGAELPATWRGRLRKQELIVQALTAREFFHRGQQYVIENGEVTIVDEFTGRLMPARKWRNGLHQAIEAKEGVEISALDETLARMSFQRFFRLFPHLCGMTGTAAEASAELWHVYRLPVVRVPQNRPCRRVELPDRIFADAVSKVRAVIGEIGARHATGQPLLIGTRNVASSEELAEGLRTVGLEFALLNATRHREEAAIIAGAGRRGAITIATNMAGRGTDIELGPGVAELGGLHVFATERHESRRVDRQLYGRAGRQGDPGSAQAFVSADDELLRRHLPEPVRGALAAALKVASPLARPLATALFARAQTSAQRKAYQQRQQVLKQDDWLDEALSFAGSAR